MAKILVVEDDVHINEMLCELLGQQGRPYYAAPVYRMGDENALHWMRLPHPNNKWYNIKKEYCAARFVYIQMGEANMDTLIKLHPLYLYPFAELRRR